MSGDLQSLLHLIWNGERAREVIQLALDSGLLAQLNAHPGTSLEALAQTLRAQPNRLFKLLDALETLGLLGRSPRFAEGPRAHYTLVDGAFEAVQRVFGTGSQERDRETYAWRSLHGRLGEVLAGGAGLTAEEFAWPPVTAEQTARFEASMVAGLGPLRAAFLEHAERLFGTGPESFRLLDVGGGDGSLAAELTARLPHLHVDVLNLEAVRPLFERVRDASADPSRLGFVALDFLQQPLPKGYDGVSFVRVLHDWPLEVAERLLDQGLAALGPGGRLVIGEEMRNAERLAAQFFWTYFLIGVDDCWSRLREAQAYVQLLERRGCAAEVLGDRVELVVGHKA